MWFLRRMLRIPWTARRANKEVLKMTGTKRELLTVIMKRQLELFGRVLRRDGLESICLLGMSDRKRARERQRLTYMDGIREAADIRRIWDVAKACKRQKGMEIHHCQCRGVVAPAEWGGQVKIFSDKIRNLFLPTAKVRQLSDKSNDIK